MESLLQIGITFRDICLPIILLIGIGWVMDRKFKLHLDSLIKLNIHLLVPAFVFVRITESSIDPRTGIRIVGFTFCILGITFLLSQAVSMLRKESRQGRAALQLSTMFYNAGNFGIPVTALAYPEVGPMIHVYVFMTLNVSSFSLGILLAHSQNDDEKEKRTLLSLLLQSPLYAVCLAWIFKGFEAPVDQWVFFWKPLNYLADSLIGIALITLGVQLSKTRPPKIEGTLAWALGIRLIGGPVIAMILVRAFGYTGDFAAVLILGTAAPTAVITALLAHEFKADSRFASATVFYSTLLSAITVTGILFILKNGWIPWI
ncbi:MAG TPA: AEC family transporter [Verrucomicrobiales bacterium]|nr:AEC family transporter [Verrucomicrobiales bacterium]HIL71183.1 AEC family transporter [Verrucomicrobiota bacterium]